MDSSQWDARYEASDLVWAPTPNTWVEQIASDLPAGRAIDLAAGEGRNAIWLAERGWSATAVDFSPVAVERARALALERLGDGADRITFAVGDLLRVRPERQAYDLVLLVYLHLPPEERWLVMRAAAEYVAPDGLLLVVGHHRDNLDAGVGGPQDPTLLYSEADLVDDLDGTGLVIERADRLLREVGVEASTRMAIDVVLVAHRPAGA
jgi:SAM-dependent methyltransferase